MYFLVLKTVTKTSYAMLSMKIFDLPKLYEYYINSQHLFFLHKDPFSMTTKYNLLIIQKETRAKKLISETSSFMLIRV